MSDGSSLINLGDVSKPVTVLIKKISNAVGVLYEPRRITKAAEAEAQEEARGAEHEPIVGSGGAPDLPMAAVMSQKGELCGRQRQRIKFEPQ